MGVSDLLIGEEDPEAKAAREAEFQFDTADVGGQAATNSTIASSVPNIDVGANWNFTLPDISFGDDNSDDEDSSDEEQSDDGSVSSAVANTQDVTQGIKLELPQLNLGKIELPQGSPSITVPNLEDFLSPDLSKIAGTVVEPVAQAAGAVAETAGNVAEAVYQPVSEVLSNLGAPVIGAVQNTLGGIAASLGTPDDALIKNVGIKQGSGGGYGEITVGDTGYVLDVSRNMDDAIASVMKDTPLAGVAGRDIFHAVSDPAGFVSEKGAEAAKDTIGKIVGDKAIANGVVDGIATALQTGDIGKAAEAAAKSTVSNAVVNTVANVANAIIPGAGVVINVLAAVFHYGCYLSTAAYANGMIDREMFLDFTRYRLRIQSKEYLATITWLGYIVTFEPAFKWLLSHPRSAHVLTKVVLRPWHAHIKYQFGQGRFSFKGWSVSSMLRVICLLGFVVRLPEAFRVWQRMENINIAKVYRDVIRTVEGSRG